jgi:hypothetical protein
MSDVAVAYDAGNAWSGEADGRRLRVSRELYLFWGNGMPRRVRLDFYGAIHYVALRGRTDSSIFFEADVLKLPAEEAMRAASDLRQFELLLARSCDECASIVHAFSWQPNSGVIVVQTYGVPLCAVMRRLCGGYSKHLHERGKLTRRQRAFQSRYDTKIVAPEYLSHAIRRAERAPVEAGLCRSPVEYPFSSCRRLGYARPRWLAPGAAGSANKPFPTARDRSRRSEAEGETPYVRALFERGSKWDTRIVGDRVFVNKAKRDAAGAVPTPSRAQIVEAVGVLVQRTLTDPIAEGSVEALKKALVARYAILSGAATLTEVARWFAVTPAAVRDGINRYRELLPGLFKASMEELFGASIAA